MKKCFMLGFLASTLGVYADETEQVETKATDFSGFYIGAGINVNQDVGKLVTEEAFRWGRPVPRADWSVEADRGTAVNYGIHCLIGGSYQFGNRLLVGFEQQAGLAHHPAKTRMVKPWELTTLAKFGYAFGSFPSVIYISGGIKALGVREINKNLIRPVFGAGYQYGISKHWSVKGDVLYTHVSSFKHTHYFEMHGVPLSVRSKVKGHRLSGALSLIYTF